MNNERYENAMKFRNAVVQYMRENGLNGSEMSSILLDYMYFEKYRMHIYIYGDWWKMNDPDTDMYEYQ